MKYTLQDFLNDHLVADVIVHTIPANPESITITSSRIQEPPFDEFFEKGELIISKVWGWESDTNMMDDLVLIAHEKEVAALIWALHDQESPIPESVIRLAENLAVPLLQVPWETSFAKLQSDVFDAVRSKEMTTAQQIQQSLFDKFLEQAPLASSAEEISHRLHCPVRITDWQGSAVSESGHIPKDTDTGIHISIETGGNTYGEVAFYPTGFEEESLFANEEYLRKYIAFPLSFWFNQENLAMMTQSRIRNDFVWDLATGAESSHEDLLSQGRYLGFDLTAPYICVMLYIHTVQESPSSETFARQLAYLTADAERIILREATRLGITVMTARVNQSFIIYIKNAPALTEDAVRDLLDRLEQNILLEIGKGYACLWGISELSIKNANFSTTYQQARQALVYGMHDAPDMSRVFYRNTRRALITTVLAGNDKIQDAAEDVFRELIAYDRKTKVGLMRTLTVFLNTNYNATRTAKELHLNRHSLLYRLHKIEQLTGLSLADHEDLFVLESFALAYAQKQ